MNLQSILAAVIVIVTAVVFLVSWFIKRRSPRGCGSCGQCQAKHPPLVQ